MHHYLSVHVRLPEVNELQLMCVQHVRPVVLEVLDAFENALIRPLVEVLQLSLMFRQQRLHLFLLVSLQLIYLQLTLLRVTLQQLVHPVLLRVVHQLLNVLGLPELL